MTRIDVTLGIDRVQDRSITSQKIALGAVLPEHLSGSQSGSAPIYGVHAWCIFDGSLTGTNSPVAGGNVSSVVKNSAGDYTVNFTVPLPTVNYMLAGSCNSNATSSSTIPIIKSATQTGPAVNQTIDHCEIVTPNYSGVLSDNLTRIQVMFLG